MNEKTRAYIYRILLALSVVAIFYGVFTEAEAAVWLSVVASILGNGLATANTTMKD